MKEVEAGRKGRKEQETEEQEHMLSLPQLSIQCPGQAREADQQKEAEAGKVTEEQKCKLQTRTQKGSARCGLSCVVPDKLCECFRLEFRELLAHHCYKV